MAALRTVAGMTSQSAEDAADLSPSAGGPGGHAGPSWFRLFLRRRWKTALAATLASAALAWAAGYWFRQVLWRSEGILVYTPLPVRELDRGLYVPPTAQTMLALIKSPGNLEALKKEFGLALPNRVLEERIKVSQPHNTEMIQIALDWPDPKDGAAMVNRLMALHTLQAAAMRKDAVTATRATVAQAHRECDDKLKAAQEKYDKFVAATKFNGIKLEAERTEKEIATLEMGLMLARHDCDSCRARQKKLGTTKAGAGGDPGTAPDADPETADLDRPYAALKSHFADLLEVEQARLTEAGKKLVARRKEYDQLMSLARDRAASRSEIQKVYDEMSLLWAQRENSAKAIERYQREMTALPAQYAAGQEAAVKEDLEEARKTIAQLEEALEDKYRRAAELAPLLRQEESLARAVKECRDDRRLLDSQLEGLRQLRDAAPTELTVAAPAAPGAHPASSSRWKVTLGAFAGALLLFLGVPVAHDRWTAARTPQGWAARLGLPLLAPPGSAPPALRPAGRGGPTGEAALADLGLRLSRHLRDARGATLFVPLHDGHEVEGLVSHIGRYLASRRERVLILDGRPGAPGTDSGVAGTPTSLGEGEAPPPPGSPPSAAAEGMAPSEGRLPPALAGEERDPVELVRSTGVPHVDHLCACGCGGVLDRLAPGCLEELLGRLSQHYPRILVIGPPLAGALEAEILARGVQGIIVALGNSAGRIPPEAQRMIRELQAEDVPFLGAVVHDGPRDGGA